MAVLIERIYTVLLNYFRIIRGTLYRDLCGLYILIRVQLDLLFHRFFKRTVIDSVQNLSKRHPNRICFLYEDQKWTFKDIQNQIEIINQYFNNKNNGHSNIQLNEHDCVGLLMATHPLYPCIWLAFGRMNIRTALINSNLVKDQLKHVISTCKCKLLIYSSEFKDRVNDLAMKDLVTIEVDLANVRPSSLLFNKDVSNDIVSSFKKPKLKDILFYIFTSGTTGMPKAAKITHNRYFIKDCINSLRFLLGGCGCYYGQWIKKSDIVYNPLPLYHAMGGWLCNSFSLLYGNTVVLKKFSVKNFWKDCVNYNCTFFMYIGELTRYLVNSPKSSYEQLHTIRAGAGNGLRKEVWQKFIDRFGKIRLIEFYAATEGNAYMFNFEGIVGSCGFNSVLFPCFLPSRLVRVDDNNEIIRDRNGRCIRCKYNETGMLVCPITNSVWNTFDGYSSKSDSERKIIRNVFRQNDKYFQTGDMLRQDFLGYYYFIDRIGDTFRWCGENVSTFELEDLFSRQFQNIEIISYGVSVNGYEGKCGMVAITLQDFDESIELMIEHISQFVRENLPKYSRPVFLRFCNSIDTTGTYKISKQRFKNDGIDFQSIKEDLSKNRIFYLSTKTQRYELLSEKILHEILNGQLRI